MDFLDYRVTDKKVHYSNGGKQSITEHELTIETAKQCESLTPFSISCTVIVEGVWVTPLSLVRS